MLPSDLRLPWRAEAVRRRRLSSALYSMLYALCAMLYALCAMLYALCAMLYALCAMRYALNIKTSVFPLHGGLLAGIAPYRTAL
jgi:hypothetical protein